MGVDGIETVIKVEQLARTVEKQLDHVSPLILSRLISVDELQRMAKQLAALHRPVRVDWAARFGLPHQPVDRAHDPSIQREGRLPVPERGALRSAAHQKQKLLCASCGDPVSYSVARFCWFNKRRFSGQVLCMDCQKQHPEQSRSQSAT